MESAEPEKYLHGISSWQLFAAIKRAAGRNQTASLWNRTLNSICKDEAGAKNPYYLRRVNEDQNIAL